MEIFKTIEGYSGQYQVSNLGNVYSTPKDGKQPRFLKQEVCIKNNTCYRRVTLSKNGKTTRALVHRLVATAFLPNTEGKPVVNHIDNNGENNTAVNLEWTTQAENIQHAVAQGRLTESATANGKLGNIALREKAYKKYTALINQSFTHLTVTGFVDKPYWLCIVTCLQCNSGKLYKVPAASLLNGLSTMCKPCAMKKAWKKRKLKPLNPLLYSDTPLVKDLGMEGSQGSRKIRVAIFHCPVCDNDFKANTNELARSTTVATKCKHRKGMII